jgi:hypothetical protein
MKDLKEEHRRTPRRNETNLLKKSILKQTHAKSENCKT